MEHFSGLDVSLKETSVCVVDGEGAVVREARLSSEPDVLVAFFGGLGLPMKRIGLEAGPLSQWLFAGLAEADLPVVCVETRHMKTALSAMANKTDRNDARGIAQMMRTGWYRPVHVKTEASQELRALLGGRKLLLHKLRSLESGIRGTLRGFGLKMGRVSQGRFEARVVELTAHRPRLVALLGPLLRARAALVAEYGGLHRMVLRAAREDAVCGRLMSVPGVGPVVALTFRATVDAPARFAKSKALGAHFGLAPRTYQSGEVDRTGRISKSGDPMMRAALFEAAFVMLTRVRRWSSLKAWAMGVARRRGFKRAVVALARRLAVLMHRMWVDGTRFRWSAGGQAA